MNKTSLILKYFQKKDFLTVKNQDYAKTVSDLFRWLTENDQVQSDQTTRFFPSKKATAKIISHQEAVLAGIEEISFLLKNHTSLTFKPFKKDKEKIKKEEVLAEISGNTHEILAYERTILNILQRMSGIATETSFLISLISPISPINLQPTSLADRRATYNPPPYIASTRKTPWMALDKKAVSLGGGLTHRLSLADGILIKDNHLTTLRKYYHLKTQEEAIEKALSLSLRRSNLQRGSTSLELIEIEVKTEKEAFAAVETFRKLRSSNHLAIMFDNFTPSQIKKTISSLISLISLITPIFPIIFEASGGITEKNILSFAQTGVDIISVGSLTHSPKAANFSLEIS